MDSLDNDFAAGIFSRSQAPCLSLYQPTHRRHPENQQDPIRFGNLVKRLEDSLSQMYSDRESAELLDQFRKLADDKPFWNHTYEGLAVLAAPGRFRVYRLQRPVAELAVVAESFHIKPLLRIVQSADRYHVLALNSREARLYEGNRDSLDLVEFPDDIVKALEEAAEIGDAKPGVQVWQLGGGAAAAGVRQRHAAGADPAEVATERFFRTVDRVILERYSRSSGLPLMVAALPEHHTPFREISRNPLLLNDGIDNHPDGLPADELRKRAWHVMEPHYSKRFDDLVEMFGTARARDLGTENLARALKAATGGRVATLLIEADRHIPGRIDAESGEISFEDLSHPEVDDLLDDLAERVLETGGQTVVVPTDRMPTASGLAAIFRF